MPVIRIPNLPIGNMVDEKGFATDDELTFRQSLITSLQKNFGNEGVVAPTQTDADITTIQDNQFPNGEYSCQFGTMIYDSTNKSMRIAVDDGTGAPIFKTVTLV